MSLNQIKLLQDRLGRTLARAKEISNDMKTNPEDGLELQVSFDASMADFAKQKLELQKLETSQATGERLRYKYSEADSKSKEQHSRAFEVFIRKGELAAHQFVDANGGSREVHALITKQADLGGFLVPEDFRDEVIRNVAGFAVVRLAGARVVPASSNTLVFPSVKTGTDPYATDLSTDNWRGEADTIDGAAPTTQNKPGFGQERIPLHNWRPDVIELSTELLQDSGPNLSTVLAEIIAEQRGLDEDSAFLNGDGVGKPEGITVSAAPQITVGSAAASPNISYGQLVDVFTGLPAQYRSRATWVFDSTTFGQILKMDDDNSRPLFPINATPGTLMTRPFLMSEFMAGPTVENNLPVVFGDFRHFVIAERGEMSIQRLEERFAPNIGLMARARIGGQLTRAASFRIGKIAA